MLIRIAAVFAGLCALGMVPLASGQTYAGTLTRYHFLIESGCGTLSTTTADYPPSQTEFGPFQVSCNGYTIVVRALKPGFDKTITATVGVGRIGWDVSPPVNENTSFSVDFTAAPGATKPKSGPFASSFATTSTSCKSAEWWKDFFSGSLTSQETVQCAETFMQISGPASASPTEGHVGMTVGAYFAGSGAPGISVGFDAYYSFAPAVPPVKVDGVEVVQVVQDSGNNIELVADKSAEVRVFVKTKDDQPRSVEATLSAPGRSTTIQKTQIANAKTGGSVDFMVDGPWVSVGNAVFNVDLKDVSTSATYSYRTDADFKENDWPKPFIVVPLLVCETNPPPKTCADAKNIVDASSFMQKIFPVADRGEYRGVLYTAPELMLVDPAKLDRKMLVTRVAKIAILSLENHADLDQMVAWLPSETAYLSSSGGKLNIAFGLETIGLIRDQQDPQSNAFGLASLVAANLGVPYLESDQLVTDLPGYDPAAGVAEPTGMKALNTNNPQSANEAWISKEQYDWLLKVFKKPATASDAGSNPAPPKNATASTYLLIGGTIAANGSTGRLDPGLLVSTSRAVAASDPNGNACLRFTAPSGAPSEYCFTVSPAAGVDPAPFAVLAPLPAGTNRVGLVARGGANDGKEVASITASAKAPTVKITYPSAGANLVAGQLEMTWTGSGSVPLTYTLLYSSDGGSTWSPIDTDVTDNSYTVDTTFITGGSKVMFRVQASDGLNNATDTVGPLTIQQTPRLVVPSGTVDFNKVLTGQGLDQSIPLRNTGNGPLTVNALTLDTATFTVSGPATPFIIAAGGQLSVAIRFKPTAGGLVTGKLTIASNDPGQPSAVVTLQAKGTTTAVPTVSLRSSALDFGNVVVGKSTDVTFVVGNLGPGDLTVSNIQSSNTAYSAPTPAVPFTVTSGASQMITVRFAPTAAGSQNSVLTLTTNDPDSPAAKVTITGNAVPTSSVSTTVLPLVVNAASGIGGGVAPGEIVLLFGSNIGPTNLAGLQLGGDGKVTTTTGNTQVLFDGIPAPMVYSFATQTAAVVPYSVAGQSSTQVQVVYSGVKSNVTSVPVVSSAPGLFTANASGKGPGAILNQDYSVNSSSNPAPVGSTVLLFATGEGQTSPKGQDGVVTGARPPAPIQPVKVTIGGVDAVIQYAGEAPSLVSGVMQINAVIPTGLPTGDHQVIVNVGSVSSPAGVTVAVRR